jgi:TonB family protein
MATAPIRSDWVGRVIDGRFTLHQWLGGSGWSGVFLTDLEGQGSRKAALKLIAADASDAETCIAHWTVTRSVSHPHLMRLFHSGRCEVDAAPLLYVVTEYAEENLAEILPERPLTPTETEEMLGPVLDALTYLHEKGFVHGRLKPSNILVVDDQLKLSSDGLSLAGEAGVGLPAAGVYDAPESDSGATSPPADVWSLGVTIVEALTQHQPVWDRLTQIEPVVPSSIPRPFFGIVQGCLRIDPARRWTLSDVSARLGLAQTQPAQIEPASPERAPAGRVSGPRSSKRLVAALMVVAVLVLVAAVGAMMLRSHEHRTASNEAQMSIPNDARQPPPSIAKPSPKTPAARIDRTKGEAITASPEAVAATGEETNGAVIERALPDILPAAKASIHGGFDLSIRLSVDAAGNVSEAEFDVPGPSKYFGRVAMEAAQRWKFKPPQVGGQAVPSVWLLQFQFTQDGTEITPTEVSP